MKFKCLLINLKAPSYMISTAPQAIAKLGGVLLKRKVWEVTYIDEQVNDINALPIDSYNLVGVSSQIGTVESLRRILKQLESHKVAVIAGNATITYGYETILKEFPHILCCIGRGEAFIWEVACKIEKGQELDGSNIPNAAYWNADHIEKGIDAYSSEDFEYRSDWEGVFRDNPVENYEEFWVEYSHGCPRKTNNVGCSFCAILPDGGKRQWHDRNFAYTRSDLMTLCNKGLRHIKFSDEEFLANNVARLKAITDLLLEINNHRNVPLTFDFSARVDDIIRMRNESILEELKNAGLSQVYLGIESGNNAQLKRMRKGVTSEMNMEAIRILNELEIRVAGGWIMFDPLMEDPIELLQNADFLNNAGLIPKKPTDSFTTSTIGRMRALVGSPLVQDLSEKKLLRNLKPNLVEFEFEYANPVIANIVKKLEEWESIINPKMIYRAKSIVSILGDRKAENEKELLISDAYFELKAMDLQVCRSLASQAVKGIKNLYIEEEFQLQRKKLSELINESILITQPC